MKLIIKSPAVRPPKSFGGEAKAGGQKGRGVWGEFRRVLAKDRG